MQFYNGEDPATGSAAGCAISYLVQRGAVAPGERVHLRQGVEIGRQSELYLSARIINGHVYIRNGPVHIQNGIVEKEFGAEMDGLAGVVDVRVAGSTVLVATGRLFQP
jgi:trans-2,3-dihydro-3-hydroxyanthranilate isomerase